jgi:hypothetical protein
MDLAKLRQTYRDALCAVNPENTLSEGLGLSAGDASFLAGTRAFVASQSLPVRKPRGG